MSRQPSEATQIRTLRRQLSDAMKDRDTAGTERNAYRQKSAQLESELAQWKHRFDALLFKQNNEAKP